MGRGKKRRHAFLLFWSSEILSNKARTSWLRFLGVSEDNTGHAFTGKFNNNRKCFWSSFDPHLKFANGLGSQYQSLLRSNYELAEIYSDCFQWKALKHCSKATIILPNTPCNATQAALQKTKCLNRTYSTHTQHWTSARFHIAFPKRK